MNQDNPRGQKKGRVRRTADNLRDVARNPRSLPTLIRRSLGRMWHARGGGYYGFGFVVTFLALEIRMLVQDLWESDSVAEFIGQQLLELVFRFFTETIINCFFALAWPALLIGQLGLWGLGLLIVGYFVFERLLRPHLTGFFPEDNHTDG